MPPPRCGHWIRCFGSTSGPLTSREPPGPDLPSQVSLGYCSYNLNNFLFLSRPPASVSQPLSLPCPSSDPSSCVPRPCPLPSLVSQVPAPLPLVSTDLDPSPHRLLSLCCQGLSCPSPCPFSNHYYPWPFLLGVTKSWPSPRIAFPPPLLANVQALVLTATI